MPVYTVEIDGTEYDLEGDHEPSEAEARAAVGGQASAPAKAPGIVAQAPTSRPGSPAAALEQRLTNKFGADAVKQIGDESQWRTGTPFMLAPSPNAIGMVAGVAKAVPGVIAKGTELGRQALGVSKARAGANIQAAVTGAKGTAVAADKAGELGLGMLDYKGIENIPRVAQSFMQRITDPKAGPLGVEEARRYLTSMGGQSANELTRMSPQMRRQLVQLQKALGEAVTNATQAAGTGGQYAKGMSEYRRASKLANTVDDLKPELKRLLKWGAGIAGLGTAYEIVR